MILSAYTGTPPLLLLPMIWTVVSLLIWVPILPGIRARLGSITTPLDLTATLSGRL
mgnify:CR=1 FL=1